MNKALEYFGLYVCDEPEDVGLYHKRHRAYDRQIWIWDKKGNCLYMHGRLVQMGNL